MLTYDRARKFIEETTKFGSVLGLSSMKALMEELNNVQNTIPTVHISGTNGKGSVGAYLASVCRQAGLKVGRYCSPAVFHPLECWQYDGNNITEEEYALCMSQVKTACDIVIQNGIQPTAFELETAMAFVYFAWKKPDVLLLEVGMGGSTDATNVVEHPLACVFTDISYDHMQFLGSTIEEITRIKAGIIKPGAKVFSARQEPAAERVLKEVYENTLEKAATGKKDSGVAVNSITFVDGNHLSMISEKPGELSFSYHGETYITQMAGHYQMKNAALAIEVFQGLYSLQDKKEILHKGIANATWPGRFEVLGTNPLFMIDGAHNEDAAKQLAQTIQNCFTNQSLAYIIGVLADKEHEKMLQIMLPHAAKVYTITPPNTRGMDGELLLAEAQEIAGKQGLSIEMEYCPSVREALNKAHIYGTKENRPILAFGSLSYLGILMEAYRRQE